MTRIVFIDTETTSLRPDRRAWDIALITRDPGGPPRPRQWFTDIADLSLGNADPASLAIGGFYDRHPYYRLSGVTAPETDILRAVEFLTRGAHLIGALPSFDTEVLGARMRAHGILPSWHYHTLDVEPAIAGWLAGQGKPVPPLPWKSDLLSELAGVTPPGEGERHTALGDATWVMRIWDAIFTKEDTP